jgi:hypothetical protein
MKKVCLFQIFKWTSSEGFWKRVKKEDSHPGVANVQVGKFLND